MANLCCAIEMEPRTLNQGQLTRAREVAVDIVHNKETDEATSIFNEGLNPVIGVKETVVMVVSDSNPAVESSREVVKAEINVGTCCQCSCINALISEDHLMEYTNVKEPFSAPF